ncbi:hypothetical protein [Robertmurraya sp. FSL R5-0851]|uniref:hypothetical protein n=1 Tax=Robertmurraya sp. FSL R5-0851 TaxID=2921584 RepID=UPI0030FAAD9B
MNKSLSTFMVIASVAGIMVFLLFGTVYEALNSKNTHHEDMMKTEHQLKFKN